VRNRGWSRREFIAATGAAISTVLRERMAMAQLPKPEPLRDASITFITTTEKLPWQEAPVFNPTFNWTMLDLNLPTEKRNSKEVPIQGFGACFNELGWTSLEALKEEDRDAVMHEVFHPSAGGRFTYCRMPVGANDFSTGAYSYDEMDGDFDLKHFSIDHDRKTLVPFIQSALKHQPDLKLWASPWTPPSWMKRNHFYAERPGFPQMGMKENGIRPDQIGNEGEDMFIQEPRYFDAYARYFGKFIDAYRAEGIKIGIVMPQNEFNSAQNFPSCTWTPEGLARFLHDLGPEMEKRGVEVYFGTLERGNPKLLDAAMADRVAAPFVKGVGVQWAGKNGLPSLHEKYPSLIIFQSEQECGDGKNAWSYTGYCWQLMKHYLRSGASGYMYWNISLASDPHSTWGWAQNSLVTVDVDARTYRFNHDYYALKHITHFVDVGAARISSTGTCDDALAFRNPDGSTVAILRNELLYPQLIQVQLPNRSVVVELPPDSFGTLSIRKTAP
jgi:glucosylceramidase